MSFSFNWAGFTVPQVQRKQDSMDRSVQAAGMLGQAVKGYRKNVANSEYSDLLKEYGNGDPSIKEAELRKELQQLKQRNAEIAAQLGM